MKNCKLSGPGGMSVELIKYGGDWEQEYKISLIELYDAVQYQKNGYLTSLQYTRKETEEILKIIGE